MESFEANGYNGSWFVYLESVLIKAFEYKLLKKDVNVFYDDDLNDRVRRLFDREFNEQYLSNLIKEMIEIFDRHSKSVEVSLCWDVYDPTYVWEMAPEETPKEVNSDDEIPDETPEEVVVPSKNFHLHLPHIDVT